MDISRKGVKMMECKKLLEELSNYIDHDIEASICDEIEKHIDGCSPCQVFIDTLRQTVKIFKEQCPQREVPEDTKKKLRERLMEKKKKVMDNKKCQQS
jgi:anti-sigma factor (TIGR02949 family)